MKKDHMVSFLIFIDVFFLYSYPLSHTLSLYMCVWMHKLVHWKTFVKHLILIQMSFN